MAFSDWPSESGFQVVKQELLQEGKKNNKAFRC